jgi:hypothetical protein
VSTRRGERNTRRADSIGTSAGPVARERRGSTVTVLAIEQALAELGIHSRLSDMVATAQSIENGIIQSRPRRKPEQMC